MPHLGKLVFTINGLLFAVLTGKIIRQFADLFSCEEFALLHRIIFFGWSCVFILLVSLGRIGYDCFTGGALVAVTLFEAIETSLGCQGFKRLGSCGGKHLTMFWELFNDARKTKGSSALSASRRTHCLNDLLADMACLHLLDLCLLCYILSAQKKGNKSQTKR